MNTSEYNAKVDELDATLAKVRELANEMDKYLSREHSKGETFLLEKLPGTDLSHKEKVEVATAVYCELENMRKDMDALQHLRRASEVGFHKYIETE